MAISKIHIFMPTGKTFTFKNVKYYLDSESVITFQYKAMSDGLLKSVTFYKHNVVGTSLCLE